MAIHIFSFFSYILFVNFLHAVCVCGMGNMHAVTHMLKFQDNLWSQAFHPIMSVPEVRLRLSGFTTVG